MPIIPTLGKQRQGDWEFKTILSYIANLRPSLCRMRSYLQTTTTTAFILTTVYCQGPWKKLPLWKHGQWPTRFWKLTFCCLDLLVHGQRLRVGLPDTCEDLIHVGDSLSGSPGWSMVMTVGTSEGLPSLTVGLWWLRYLPCCPTTRTVCGGGRPPPE